MRITLYICKDSILNDKDKLLLLEDNKNILIQHYQGLTVQEGLKGYYVAKNGQIIYDNVETWTILGENIDTTLAKQISLNIKSLTNQESQLITFNAKTYPLFQ
jgi:hypothetical protein